MHEDNKITVIEAILLGTFDDGGTKCVRDINSNKLYYIDGRTEMLTQGKIFDKYPGQRLAKILSNIDIKIINKE